jgi:Type II secretion system (T2SS), protein E, N-terminal domain
MASFPLRRDSDVQERPTVQSPQQQAQEMLNVPLGTLIYRAGLLSQEDLQEALQQSIRSEKMLGEVLLERGMVEERELGRLVAGQKGLPFVDLDRISVDHDAARRLPEDVAREHSALPVAVDPQGTPLVAVANPSPVVLAAVTQAFGAEPHVGVAARDELLRAIDRAYGGPAAEQPSLRIAHVDEVEQEPVVEPVAEEPVDEHVEESHESVDEEIADAGLAPLHIEPWGRPSEDERVEEPADEETEEDDTFDEVDDDRVAPTASLAEAPEPVDEETPDEEDASESADDEKPIFAWAGRSSTEETVAETGEHDVEQSTAFEADPAETETADWFADAPQSLDEDVAELVESSEAVPTMEDDDSEESAAATYGVTDESVHHVGEPSSNGWNPEPSFGEQPVLALVAADDDETETVEQSFDDADSSVGVAELETADETELMGEPTDEAVLYETELEADQAAPVDEEVDKNDTDVDVVDDAVEAELAAAVYITLVNGERLSSGRFASEREATAHTQSLLSDLRREWWPKVGTRLIRPEAVISIDLEAE